MCPHSVATGLTHGSARQDLQWKDKAFAAVPWLPSSVVVAVSAVVVGVATPLLESALPLPLRCDASRAIEREQKEDPAGNKTCDTPCLTAGVRAPRHLEGRECPNIRPRGARESRACPARR